MVYSTRRFVVCLSVCHFVLVFFSPFSIAITSLGEERANLSAFCTFVRFVLVWICRFSLPLGVWEGLRIVIVALPGLFSYLFSYVAKMVPFLFLISTSFCDSVGLCFVFVTFPGYLHLYFTINTVGRVPPMKQGRASTTDTTWKRERIVPVDSLFSRRCA